MTPREHESQIGGASVASGADQGGGRRIRAPARRRQVSWLLFTGGLALVAAWLLLAVSGVTMAGAPWLLLIAGMVLVLVYGARLFASSRPSPPVV